MAIDKVMQPRWLSADDNLQEQAAASRRAREGVITYAPDRHVVRATGRFVEFAMRLPGGPISRMGPERARDLAAQLIAAADSVEMQTRSASSEIVARDLRPEERTAPGGWDAIVPGVPTIALAACPHGCESALHCDGCCETGGAP